MPWRVEGGANEKDGVIFVPGAPVGNNLAFALGARRWGRGPQGRTGSIGPMDLIPLVPDTTATTGRDMPTTDRASTGRATITDGSWKKTRGSALGFSIHWLWRRSVH